MVDGSGNRRARLPLRWLLLLVLCAAVLILGAQAAPYVLGPGMIGVNGQVGLRPGDFATDGEGRCSGQGRYAEFRNGNKLGVAAGNWATAATLGYDHVVNGRCEFPIQVDVPKGKGTYVFEVPGAARWTVAEADLARPLELTVDASSTV